LTLKNTDNAVIEIINHQTDSGSSDTIETRYSGRFYENNGKFYIMYNESENVSCMIRTSGNTVTIKRSGEASSVMVCESGMEHSFLYKMPYGAMEMRIRTDSVKLSLNSRGGSIGLSYELYVNGGSIKNNMNIRVTENRRKQ
jgi:uncharacterized beta-barrel protein YwiB (DUF1934 family)